MEDKKAREVVLIPLLIFRKLVSMQKRKRGANPSSLIDLTSSDQVCSRDSVQWNGLSSYESGSFPHRERSRGSQSKNLVCKRFKRLNSGQFESYLEKFWSSLPEHQKISLTYFDSLWFGLYREASSREKVLSWITRKQIFSKKYVFVPIVCWGHWNLLIFCHFGEDLRSTTRTPCMLLLDSLQASDPRSRFEYDIRKFVIDIFRAEGRPEKKHMIQKIPLLVPKVPQQRDSDECGNFVMHFIKFFVKSAPEDFNLDGYPYFMQQDWFNPDSVEGL